MGNLFGTGFYGKQKIVSHYDHCETCHKLAALSSYTTARFINLRQFPLIPIGKTIRIIDECPYCGHRSIISNRKYQKKRKEDLAGMMDSFTSEGDNPYAALNGLQTLLVYNEKSWFMDVMQSYGKRFDTHMVVQLLIAQGLCRFGHYSESETYARKAIVLGAGPHAEELLAFCQSQLEKKDAGHVESLSLQPESIVRPYAFITLVVASFFIGLVVNGISATRNHTAWLVNGSHKPYSVEIDGTLYHLHPYGLKRIKLHLGKHLMQTRKLPNHTTSVSFDYKISLLRQKFGNHALILNPDAIAVMIEETLMEGQTTNHYLFGKVINALENVDYPFASFPLWADSKETAQTRLFTHIPSNHLEMVEFLREHNPVNVAEYARRVLLIDPLGEETENLLSIATSNLSTKQAIAFLQRGKMIFPPLPVWHRFYQNFMEVQQPEYDLQSEYAKLCKTHPNTPEYYYLLGRVARNHTTAKLFFEKSETGSGSQGQGYQAIAYDLLCSGRFNEAQTFSKKALKQSPNHPEFEELNQQIHIALQQYDNPLRQVLNDLENNPDDIELVAKKIKYLTLLGEHKAATEAVESFPSSDESEDAYLHAARFYAVGNATDYLAKLLLSRRENANLQQLLHTGDVEVAHHLLSQNKNHEYIAHLILYCAANYHGYPKIAETELATAIVELGSLTPAQKEATTILSSETPVSTQQILDLRIMPKEKSILCASLGFKFPSQRKSFFKLSRKLNCTPEYPQLLIKKWTRPQQPPPSDQRAKKDGSP